MTSRTVVWVLAILVGWGGIACEKSEESADREESSEASEESDTSTEEGPTIVHPEGVDAGSETVIATAGEIEVTLGAYDRFLRRTRLFAPGGADAAPEIPAERKANPRLQSQTVRSLLEDRVLKRLADERGVEIGSEAVAEFIRSHESLRRWSDVLDADAGDGVELPDGLAREDLRAVARSRLRRRELRDELVEPPGEKELWELYKRRETKIRIAYVALENTPESDEIDAFVEEHSGDTASKLREYFEEHSDRYRQPKLVEVAVVRPEGGADVAEEKLREAAANLEGDTPARKVAEELGLEFEERSYLRRRENREAFGAEQGETGYQTDGPRGAYAWRVEGWREGKLPELDRGLRREVAADMLRREVVPSVREQLESVLEVMRSVAEETSWPIESEDLEPVRRAISDVDAPLKITEPFARNRRGSVPGLGLAEPVMEAAWGLDPSDPVADEPILNRERAVALMLTERQKATREEFERRRESFREKVLESHRKGAVSDYLKEWFSEHEPSVDMEPVQAKYGRLEK